MLTSDTSEGGRATAGANGAAGDLLKGSDPELILDAIRRAPSTAPPCPEKGGHSAPGEPQ